MKKFDSTGSFPLMLLVMLFIRIFGEGDRTTINKKFVVGVSLSVAIIAVTIYCVMSSKKERKTPVTQPVQEVRNTPSMNDLSKEIPVTQSVQEAFIKFSAIEDLLINISDMPQTVQGLYYAFLLHKLSMKKAVTQVVVKMFAKNDEFNNNTNFLQYVRVKLFRKGISMNSDDDLDDVPKAIKHHIRTVVIVFLLAHADDLSVMENEVYLRNWLMGYRSRVYSGKSEEEIPDLMQYAMQTFKALCESIEIQEKSAEALRAWSESLKETTAEEPSKE
jgi:hypothetical protein